MILYGILAAAIEAGDQLVKWWAVKALGPGGSWDVLPGIFSLTYAENQGAAFSILEGKRLFFVGMTVVMISHDPAAALRYASHILYLGEPVYYGTREGFLATGAGQIYSGRGNRPC